MKTLRKQISENGAGALTSSQEDSLASLFPTQENGGGADDDRYLWPEMLRVVDEVRPTWVVGENVAGVTTMVEEGILTDMGREEALFNEDNGLHGYSLRESFTIEKVCKDLENIGYTVQPMLIPAAAVGAPHRRDRVFILAHAENSVRDGQLLGQQEEQGSQRNVRDTRAGNCERVCKEAGVDASDTNSRGGGEVSFEICARVTNGGESFCDGCVWDSPHTFCSRLAAYVQRGCNGTEEWDGTQRSVERSSYDAWTKGTWWDNFPTVSPVQRGNDGIPFRLDHLALPAGMQPRSFRKSSPGLFQFNKWRTESLKAYGNAIVPQVMYRIFQAIEQTQESQI